jgi:hypothetical protein
VVIAGFAGISGQLPSADPAGGLVIINSEFRRLRIWAESRNLRVPAESRTLQARKG